MASSPAINQYSIPERESKLAIFDGSYLKDIPYFISTWQCQRIVLVVSKALYNNTDHVQKLEAQLGSQIVGKQIGVGSHSPYRDVISIAHLLQEERADCLISIGSSSYNDASKIASKLANTLPRGFTAEDMEALVDKQKGKAVTEDAAIKLILVPTSLSAAEWNGVGSCTNVSGKKQHFGVVGMKLGAADLVLCDPELASTAPEHLWLSSGVRCIDHCVESVCNRDCTEDTERDALTGLREMLRGLVEYKHNLKGSDKTKMLKGISDSQKGSKEALKATIMYGNSMGPSHAIGHQLGSVAGVAHGVTSCIMLPPVLRYTAENAESNPHFARARHGQQKVLEVCNDTFGWHETTAADAIEKFVKEVGLPSRLGDVGVTSDSQIDRIADKTCTDIWGGKPRQISAKEDIKKILDSAR